MTVHGEREKLPAVTKAEGAKALQRFADGFNKAYSTVDPKINSTFEAGALLASDQASVKQVRGRHPGGFPNFTPLTFKDAHFSIPKQAGWPKSFVADAVTNRVDKDKQPLRWYLVFSRDSIDAKWRAVYLATFKNNDAPKIKEAADGFAEAVPTGGASGLTAAPGKLSTSYADYLRTGKGEVFASGPDTTEWRATRAKEATGVGSRIDYEDTPANFPPVALRTEDGGALAFFATYYHRQKTVSPGIIITITPELKGILQGPMKKTNRMAFTNISGQAVKVPAKGSGGKVEILNRLDVKTSAKAL
ncbi:hypothetical protein AB0D04_01865 [Streptomyces sp. NPDC048483]|uniref:hypothetical protein n=1 Tax=Streptomyces sp. NPDC048483 TaxID=3154927 RepID=UPI00341D86DC